jgi:hypothetical protein
MCAAEWGIVIGVVTPVLLALAPWMFMVHAKLAVIAAQMVELGEQVEKAAEANQQLWMRSAQHEARLDTHDVQFAHVAERLREL